MTQLVCRQLAQHLRRGTDRSSARVRRAIGTAQRKPEPKPEPTAQELFEYVRSALILLSPDDGINDNLEVTFNPATQLDDRNAARRPLRSISRMRSTQTMSAWDVFDPSDASRVPRTALAPYTGLRQRQEGAEPATTRQNKSMQALPANRVRLLFSLSQGGPVAQLPGQIVKGLQESHRAERCRTREDIFYRRPQNYGTSSNSDAPPLRFIGRRRRVQSVPWRELLGCELLPSRDRRPAFRQLRSSGVSATTFTLMCAVTSRCSLMATLNSPTLFSGSAQLDLAAIDLKATWPPSSAAMSAEVTEPNSGRPRPTCG